MRPTDVAWQHLPGQEATTAVEAVVTGDAFGDDELEGNGVADVEEGGAGVAAQPGEQSFMCTVCRKVFKREMNLIFHMTTHRPRQPQLESADTAMSQPVKCQDCGKVCTLLPRHHALPRCMPSPSQCLSVLRSL